MAEPAANGEVQQLTCSLCSLSYAPDKGRVHGRKFQCVACASADLRVLKGHVSMSDPACGNHVAEANELEYKCVTYSRNQLVRLVTGTTACIHFFRCKSDEIEVYLTRMEKAEKEKHNTVATTWKFLPGAPEFTDARRLDQTVSPQYFRSNGDGSVCLLW